MTFIDDRERDIYENELRQMRGSKDAQRSAERAVELHRQIRAGAFRGAAMGPAAKSRKPRVVSPRMILRPANGAEIGRAIREECKRRYQCGDVSFHHGERMDWQNASKRFLCCAAIAALGREAGADALGISPSALDHWTYFRDGYQLEGREGAEFGASLHVEWVKVRAEARVPARRAA